MVRRKPTVESGDEDAAVAKEVGSVSQTGHRENNDIAAEASSPTPTSPSSKKGKKKKGKPGSKKNLPVETTAVLESPLLTSSPSLVQLQSVVGKLNAFSEVMINRMNFYEQQMELMWNVKDHAEQKQLLTLYRKQMQQLMEQTSSKEDVVSPLDQLTVETSNLQEQERLTQKWIEKLERDRELYQQRLTVTYEELKTQKQRQARTQKQLQKLQLQHERQLQLQLRKLGNDEEMEAAVAVASAPSSNLVDDMMDSFYKQWSNNLELSVGDSKTATSSKKKRNKKS